MCARIEWRRFLPWCKSEHFFKTTSSIMPLEGWNARWSQRFRNVGSTEVDCPPSTHHNLPLIPLRSVVLVLDSTDSRSMVSNSPVDQHFRPDS